MLSDGSWARLTFFLLRAETTRFVRGKEHWVTERVPPHWKVKLDGTVGGQLPARPLGTSSGSPCNQGQKTYCSGRPFGRTRRQYAAA